MRSGSGSHQPASLPLAGDGPAHCWLALLCYSLSPLFSESASSALDEHFLKESSLSLSFFFLSLAIPRFGLLSHVSSLRLPSGHSGLVRTLNNAAGASLFSPCLLKANVSIGATSPLGAAVRRIICEFYLFFSFQLCCPVRFQKFPQTHY